MSRANQSAMIAPRGKLSLTDVLRAAKRTTELGLSVAFPCTVTKFDPDTQLLEVLPDFIDIAYTDDGTKEQELNPLVSILLSTEGQGRSGGGYLTFPIEKGDKGYVTVTDRSLDTWIEIGEPRDPKFNHTHRRIDGIFRPLRDKTRAIPSFDSAATVLEHTLIKLGKDATKAAAREGDTVSAGTTPVIAPVQNMTTWIAAVTVALQGLAPGLLVPVDFGDISSGSGKVKIDD